jgi:hypothetical protein
MTSSISFSSICQTNRKLSTFCPYLSLSLSLSNLPNKQKAVSILSLYISLCHVSNKQNFCKIRNICCYVCFQSPIAH